MAERLTERQRDLAARFRALGDVACDAADARARRGHWRGWFASRRPAVAWDGRLVLDVGCAEGAMLCRAAGRQPGTAFVGLDWKFDDALLAAEAAASTQNVAILRGRAATLSEFFAPGEIDEIWVFHPEPLPEPRQRPNRLLAEPFLLAAAASLRPGGTLAIKTDHAGYYRATLGLFGLPEPAWSDRARLRDVDPLDRAATSRVALAAAFEVACASADFWNDEAALAHAARHAFAGERTGYEQRFVDRRRPIHYLALRSRMEPMKPMQPMKPLEPMRPMEPMKPMEPVTGPWPEEYGSPNAAGAQNGVRYAYFGDRRRLIVERDGDVREYDTGDHRIGGIQQAQGDASHLVFTSQLGPVALDALRRVERAHG